MEKYITSEVSEDKLAEMNEVSKFATLAFMKSDGKYHG